MIMPHVALGDVVMFWPEASHGSRIGSKALVCENDHGRLTVVFVNPAHVYSDERREAGALMIVSDVPYIEAIRDSVDGSTMAAHWTASESTTPKEKIHIVSSWPDGVCCATCKHWLPVQLGIGYCEISRRKNDSIEIVNGGGMNTVPTFACTLWEEKP